MNKSKKLALSVAGCFFAAFFCVTVSRCDYVDAYEGFEISVSRASFLTQLTGSHGRSEEAVLRIGGEEFRMLAGRSPFYLGDRQGKWLACFSMADWPTCIVVIIDQSLRKYARAECPLDSFGSFIGMADNPDAATYDRNSGSLTLIDGRLNRSAVLNKLDWQTF